ncbi:hypothetical protein CDAR_245731 [Caerostris darwini]|uniref:Uncharacterized protein n=1 Tax=Caerostris darwini TaxID=1538125 RepID=A0AAV4S3A4_9ARAC|nr:hypothetical protein CDAR_245731 [Caerostris darwini]
MHPVIHSLQHLALVKASLTLCRNPDIEFHLRRISLEPVTNVNETLFTTTRLIASLDIAFLFKRKLLRFMVSIYFEYKNFVDDNSKKFNIAEHFPSICWKSYGMIDWPKSLEALMGIQSVPVMDRFELARMYQMRESMESLSNEMSQNQTGTKDYFSCIVLRGLVQLERSRVPESSVKKTDWARAAEVLFLRSRRNSRFMSDLLSMFKPGESNRYITQYFKLNTAYPTDVGFQDLDIDKRIELFKKHYASIMLTCCHWTLRDVFMYFTDEFYYLWDEDTFFIVMVQLLKSMYTAWGDINYINLVKEFWLASPVHLRENLKENDLFYAKLKSVLDGRYEASINSAFEILDSWLADPGSICTKSCIFVLPLGVA